MHRAFTTTAKDSEEPIAVLSSGATLFFLAERERWRRVPFQGYVRLPFVTPDIEREPMKDASAAFPSPSVTQVEERSEPLLAVSESALESLATQEPEEFLAVIASERLEPADLTLAAEIAGTITSLASVVPVLLNLLKHPSPMVREGAVYGLSSHLSWSKQARRALNRLLTSKEEPSPGVRRAAEEALELVDE